MGTFRLSLHCCPAVIGKGNLSQILLAVIKLSHSKALMYYVKTKICSKD